MRGDDEPQKRRRGKSGAASPARAPLAAGARRDAFSHLFLHPCRLTLPGARPKFSRFKGHPMDICARGAPGAPVLNAARAEAGRRNGAKSKGPRTAEGKARSSQNAIKHGLRARKRVVLHGESETEFKRLEAALIEELAPDGVLRSLLAQRVARWSPSAGAAGPGAKTHDTIHIGSVAVRRKRRRCPVQTIIVAGGDVAINVDRKSNQYWQVVSCNACRLLVPSSPAKFFGYSDGVNPAEHGVSRGKASIVAPLPSESRARLTLPRSRR
jgi:hypothetical protein